jgi:hypothetical protein
MSARDEFPILHMQERGGSVEAKKALDKIDQLRAQIKGNEWVSSAVDSLLQETTRHADAMAKVLCRVRDTSGGFVPRQEQERLDADVEAAIEAYDNFIKEA